MITHSSDSRGVANHGWLKSRHTFSFGDYYDPSRMGFGTLRVINDDSVAPGAGFGTHPHKEMEIVSIPLLGSLQHKDNQGNMTTIRKGEVQIMSAGTGIAHSEFNGSENEEVKFLQIWVLPKRLGIKPRYEQKAFVHEERLNKFCLVVSPDGREGSITINQDAYFSLCDLDVGKSISYTRKQTGNGLYILVLSGEIDVNNQNLGARDGLGIEYFESVEIKAHSSTELLLMEVPL